MDKHNILNAILKNDATEKFEILQQLENFPLDRENERHIVFFDSVGSKTNLQLATSCQIIPNYPYASFSEEVFEKKEQKQNCICFYKNEKTRIKIWTEGSNNCLGLLEIRKMVGHDDWEYVFGAVIFPIDIVAKHLQVNLQSVILY